MSAGTVMREHEAEPVPGLPERLPAGERLLWQGAPTWRGLARHAFRTRVVAGYFGVLVGWRITVALADGAGVAEALMAGLWIAGLGTAAVGVLSVLAWLMARSTLYTITDRRLVMRFGVALPMTINVPFSLVQGASVRRRRDGGDIALEIARPNKISYLVLWPNVRPWHMAAPQPTLRALADPQPVADLLAGALQASLAPRPQPHRPARPVVSAPSHARAPVAASWS